MKETSQDEGMKSHGSIGDEKVETGSTGGADKGGLPDPGEGRGAGPRDPALERELREALEKERRRRERQQLGPKAGEEGGDLRRFVESLRVSGLLKSRQSELEYCQEINRATEAAAAVHHRELPYGVDSHDLSKTGWGVICVAEDARMVRYRLRELLSHRKKQAGKRFRDDLFFEPSDSARSFLAGRHGVAPGLCDPNRVPYYLLLVGDPERIPFDFQYLLNANHAVGRLWFDDEKDFERYAENVIEAETRGVDLARRATIFSVDDGKGVGRCLEDFLVCPLEERLPPAVPDWKVDVWREEKSTKADLGRLLGGDETPALLLAACHGREKRPEDLEQEALQGGLVCREASGGAGNDSVFYATDLSAEARLRGQIAFLFACYGAGTPVEDNFPLEVRELDIEQPVRPRPLARRPFLAHLPQALLRQGALAVLGHVDCGWTLSFQWLHRGRESEAVRALEDSVKMLLDGHRLGESLRPLYRRYLAIAAHLQEPMEQLLAGRKADLEDVADLWTAHNDARNFIVLGDPAVYVRGRRPK